MSDVPLPAPFHGFYGVPMYSADQMHAHAAAVSAQDNARLRERNRLEMAGIVQVIATHANNLQNFAGNLDAAINATLKGASHE